MSDRTIANAGNDRQPQKILPPCAETSTVGACPDCDLLYNDVALQPGQQLRCRRCGTILHAPVADSLNKTIALSLTGLLLFLPAMTEPVMTITLVGLEGKSSVAESMLAMLQTGYPFVGTMVFLTAMLFPLVKLSLLFWVTLLLRAGSVPRSLAPLFRTYKHLNEWGMTEVYMLGILVSLIKMHSMGNLDFNLGFFCFVALCLVTVAASSTVDEPSFWRQFDTVSAKRYAMPTAFRPGMTARQAGLMSCHDCRLLVRTVTTRKDEIVRCPRCGAPVHERVPNSLAVTWALLICASVLFLPANLLPIMRVDFFGRPEITTIMDGVIYFFKEEEYFVGAIILTASVLVPLFKIVGMTLILLSIHFGWNGWLKQKARMFRFVEFIGRWSFLDIFVIALLAAMIQFGVVSSIIASPAARYFTAVVIVTMFAARYFDARILWDYCAKPVHTPEEKDDRGNH